MNSIQSTFMTERRLVVKDNLHVKQRLNLVRRVAAKTDSLLAKETKGSKKNPKNVQMKNQSSLSDSRIPIWSNSDFPTNNGVLMKPSAFVINSRAKSSNLFYAGSSFSDSPCPSTLPPPPSHWMSSHTSVGSSVCSSSSDDDLSITSTQSCAEITTALKLILNVGEH